MKQSSVILKGKLTAILIGSFTMALMPLGAQAQSDNFNDGNDTANPAWTHYEPLQPFGAGGIWTFPGGNTYRIQATTSPAPGTVGPGRAASVLPSVYSSFYFSVDVVDWDDTLDQAFGILARLENIGLGQTTGYVFTYQELDHDVSITKITGEQPADLPGSSKSITLDKANDYRFVFMGVGEHFEGRIYQLPDTTTPIIVVNGTDSSYSSGQCGLLVFDNSSGGAATADATFDNFFASTHDPRAVVDNFDDGNDTSPAPAWVHRDPIAEAGVPGACYSGATYTFPSGGYRILSPLPCVPDAGGPRAYSLRQETTWTDFYISVDALNWDDTVHQLFGIVARASNVGPGTTDGYLFTWEDGSDPLPNTTGGDLDVLRIQGEGAVEAHQMEHDVPGQDSGVHLNTGDSYRFVFIGKGSDFEARLYKMPDVQTPIKRLLALDTLSMFSEGTIGLIVADHPDDMPFHACRATFDNFYANSAEPRLTITPDGADLNVSWPVLSGLWILQSTTSLAAPLTWTPVTTGISYSSGTMTYTATGPVTDNQYYRLIKL